jgi:hypothetical protein
MQGRPRWLHQWGIRVDLHHPDKAIAIASPGLDELLHVPTVPDGLARPFDAALQRRLTDELTGPHLRTQFLPKCFQINHAA